MLGSRPGMGGSAPMDEGGFGGGAAVAGATRAPAAAASRAPAKQAPNLSDMDDDIPF